MTPSAIRKRWRAFKRHIHSKLGFIVASVALFVIGSVAYAGYMSTQPLDVDPASYTSLLNLIAKVESNGNYNAHFGNSKNSEIDFTSMTIAEVLQWQKDFVAQGSPSSAVGRYQIINGTLEGLVNQLGFDVNQKFDRPTQDAMAIALLERRGSIAYVNKELSDKDFAANLAQEWAALPKIVGDNPEQSYYANDGLNKSRVASTEVLSAIKPIEAK